MPSGVGHRLLAFLRELSAATPWAVAVEETGTGRTWRLAGTTWSADVVVDPHRWLGLAFGFQDPATGTRVGYDIDTDLYDITQPDQREFADEVERDIIEFVDNLGKGAVLRGNDGSKSVLVFPRSGAYVRVVGGRLMTRASTHPTLSAARRGGDYVPLD